MPSETPGDLFELATFGTNYGSQTADKDITDCMKVALQYFSPFPAKRRFEMIDSLVFFSGNLVLQNAPGAKFKGLRPGAKVQRIETRRFWWPLCSKNEAKNFLF